MAKTERFKTLSWAGPQMPDDYIQDVKTIKGQPVSKDCAEAFVLLARYIDTDYYKNPTFQANAWDYFKTTLPKSLQTKLSDFSADFKKYHDKQVADKEAIKKLQTKDDREAAKADREAKKQKYGFADVDGKRTPIAGYMIEQPGFIITRGKDPRIGGFKKRVLPSDVTVNIVGDPAKAAQLAKLGFNVVSDNKVLWLYKYTMNLTSSKVGVAKKVNFAITSDFGHGQEAKKYDKAVELLAHWDEMQAHIEAAIKDKNEKRSQAGLIAYLIQRTAIRVGVEKDLNEYADTVGASTLKKGSMTVTGNTLSLNFLGKDSVPYKNEIEIDSFAATAISKLLKGNPNDFAFDKADGADVSLLLKEVVPGISPKTFRTAKGTLTLVERLKAKNVKATDSILIKQKALFEASLETSQLLNHQKNIGKNFKEQEAKAADRVKDVIAAVSVQKTKNADKLRQLKKDLEVAKTLWEGQKLKDKVAQIKARIEKIRTQADKGAERIERAAFTLEMKQSTSDISVSTARGSYCDPRVLYSWSKDVDFPIEKIYTKGLQARMEWADKTPANFWKKYPAV